MIDIPEEEARYWTYKLEQINALGTDNEVGTVFYNVKSVFIGHFKGATQEHVEE